MYLLLAKITKRRSLLEVFAKRHKGCTAREMGSATGLSEEIARACLEYLRQDGKLELSGGVYSLNPRYVQDAAVTHAVEVVENYLRRVKRATFEQIVQGTKGDLGTIKPEWVKKALLHLAYQQRVRYDQMTGSWIYLLLGA
jgi:hypothetical protein